jgi:hypothetical protein
MFKFPEGRNDMPIARVTTAQSFNVFGATASTRTLTRDEWNEVIAVMDAGAEKTALQTAVGTGSGAEVISIGADTTSAVEIREAFRRWRGLNWTGI